MIFDVLVIGSGIAGLNAALEASRRGVKVAVVCKSLPLRSNSSVASGGINAVLATMEEDTIEAHVEDTLKGGKGLSDKRAVQVMCERAPKVIQKFKDLGVPFDETEEGEISQRSFGGSGKKRTCYIGDKTGAAIVQKLFMKCREAGVLFIPHTFVMNLLISKKRICGVTVLRKKDSSVVVYVAKSIILASGGYAGIFNGHTTNPQDSNGDMIAAALRAGLWVKNLEFVQFHPTGLKRNGALISEAARGEGGHLVNSDGKWFVDELSTRDVITQAIIKQMNEGKEVFLDIRHLPPEKIQKKLPSLKQVCWVSMNIDVEKELIPIVPVAHYTMGGIETDINTKTSVEGLYACGEVACNGVHGANRLGGNSLIEGAVFGEIAGENAAKFAIKNNYMPIDYEIVAKDIRKVEYYFEGENLYNVNSLRKQLGKTLFKEVGVYRDEASLIDAFEYIKYLRRLTAGLHCINKSKDNNVEIVAILELYNALEIAEALVFSAMNRAESRGAHQRLDKELINIALPPSHTRISEIGKGFFKIEQERAGILHKTLRKIKTYLTN